MKKYPDISHYHPVENWNKVKNEVKFLISKATQGTKFVDKTLESFIKGCEAHSIPYWLYAYLNKGNELEQAKFLVSTCAPKVRNYFVGYILDVEEENSPNGIKEALDYLIGTREKTMLYTQYSQYSVYESVISGRPETCAWWEARYGKNNGEYSDKYPCHNGVDLHQFTSAGLCSGIKGAVDLNRITGNKKESWFVGKAETANQPKPEAVAVPDYEVGTVYTTQVELKVRSGAGTNYRAKTYSKLTSNAKTNDKGRDGAIDKGTKVTCKALKAVGSDIWMQIPSGWIAAYYQGKVYVK